MTDTENGERETTDKLTSEIYNLLDSLFIAKDEEGNELSMEEVYENLASNLRNLIREAVEEGSRDYKKKTRELREELKSELRQEVRAELKEELKAARSAPRTRVWGRIRSWTASHLKPILVTLGGFVILALAALAAGSRADEEVSASPASNEETFDYNLEDRLGMLG